MAEEASNKTNKKRNDYSGQITFVHCLKCKDAPVLIDGDFDEKEVKVYDFLPICYEGRIPENHKDIEITDNAYKMLKERIDKHKSGGDKRADVHRIEVKGLGDIHSSGETSKTKIIMMVNHMGENLPQYLDKEIRVPIPQTRKGLSIPDKVACKEQFIKDFNLEDEIVFPYQKKFRFYQESGILLMEYTFRVKKCTKEKVAPILWNLSRRLSAKKSAELRQEVISDLCELYGKSENCSDFTFL